MNDQVLLVGGGGHAKVIADIFLGNGIAIAGCICPAGDSQLAGVPWLGDDTEMDGLEKRGIVLAHVAVGSNRLRRKLTHALLERGIRLVSAVSHRAIVSSTATIGQGSAVMPGVVINASARIGDCAIINTAATIDHDCQIGDYSHIGPGCHLAGNVVVGEGTFVGIGSSVIPSIQIGSWAVVGAGAVVTKALADSVTAVGVPARVIKGNK